jgi:hypothetical protein
MRRGMGDYRAQRPQQFRTGGGELAQFSFDHGGNPLFPRRCQSDQEAAPIQRVTLPRHKALPNQFVDNLDHGIAVDIEGLRENANRGRAGARLPPEGQEHPELRSLQSGLMGSVVCGIN